MFDKWLNLPAHLYLRITALTILTVGITLSNVLMSIGAIWIIANWLIEADFNAYKRRFKEKKSVWLVVTLFFLLLLSLLWSEDFGYGFKDLRVKLPFIVVPLVMATSEPLKTKHFYFLLYVFLGMVAFTSGFNYIRYNYFIDHAGDIREMSAFISHVRFSVLVNFAFFIGLWLLIKKKPYPILWLVLCAWFLFYLYKSQIINGYVLFVVLTVYSFITLVNSLASKRMKAVGYGLMVAGVLVSAFAVSSIVSKLQTCGDPVVFEELELYTPNGNPYHHDTTNHQLENGHLVWMYVNQKEMATEWQKRSTIPYDSLDKKGQPMYGTLMRYLTSKGLRKDSAGVHNLSNDEVAQIENGQTSITVNKGLITRLSAFMMEYEIYQAGGDPNGYSLIQRIEHLKAAIGIIGRHGLTGVGVGDVPLAFDQQYAQMNSLLYEENRHRSHNQFLTIWVSLGVVGFGLFMLLLIWPVIERRPVDYFLGMVLIGLTVSCLFQDLIETQAGVTIFALFYALAAYREVEKKA